MKILRRIRSRNTVGESSADLTDITIYTESIPLHVRAKSIEQVKRIIHSLRPDINVYRIPKDTLTSWDLRNNAIKISLPNIYQVYPEPFLYTEEEIQALIDRDTVDN